jgi:hypothetical protein
MSQKVNGDNRLLIVLGMARAGTTIFAHALASHPRIYLHRDGSEAFVLENECLKSRNLSEVQRIINLHLNAQYILLKRPWKERHYAWFKTHLPGARHFICIRNREEVIRSWRSTGNWAVRGHAGVRINAVSYYRQFKIYALIMKRIFGEGRCMLIDYGKVVHRKGELFREIADWLNLDFQFALDEIRPGGSWHGQMGQTHFKSNPE